MLDSVVNRLDEIKACTPAEKIMYGVPYLDKATGGIRKSELVVLGAPTGLGKCLGGETKVLMLDGSFKQAREVVAGDLLMGDDSTPRRVLSVCTGREEMYVVKPIKGDVWACNKSHILSLVHTTTGKIDNISIRDYLNKSNNYKHLHKLRYTGVEFKEQEVLIEPYMAGLWLGDGTFKAPTISSSYLGEEVRMFSERHGYEYKKAVYGDRVASHRVNKGKHKVNHFYESLNQLKKNNEKRIHSSYLINSRKNRLEMLAGLLDSDGYLSENCFEITTKYDGLKDDILFLARSLGFKVSCRRKKGTIKVLDFEAYYWRMYIFGDCSVIPTKFKIAGKRRQIKNHLRSGFSLESLGEGNYYGFEIDKNKLFIVEDFCITHNTEMAGNIAKHNAMRGKKVAYFALEAEENEIEKRELFKGICEMYYKQPVRPESYLTYREWYDGDYSLFLRDIEKAVKEKMADTLSNMFTFYRDKSGITTKELVDEIKETALDGFEFVIIDHLHYIDFNSNKENEAMKELMKNLIDLALLHNIPILAIAHLRKKQKAEDQLLPAIDDFHGSSDITKIATQVVLMAHDDNLQQEAHRFPTLFQVVKMRMDSSAKKYIGMHFFNTKMNQYEPYFDIGFAKDCRKGFLTIDEDKKLPKWAKEVQSNAYNSTYETKQDVYDTTYQNPEDLPF